MRTLLLTTALVATACSSFANDSERLREIENEIYQLKVRVKQLENAQPNANNQQKQVVANEGAKSLVNWRRLKTGMSYDDVRALLGEPTRIEGGSVSYWYYLNQASVVFIRDKLERWNEPQ